MKKIILLSALVVSTLISCSTDDVPTFNQNSTKATLVKENGFDYTTMRGDSICRSNDSINGSVNPKPIKP